MRKGFTIIELLVASLLLGMLVTILTMIFNQSSIAWRLGVAGVSDMDDIRDNMAELRDEADNAFIWSRDQKVYRLTGLWKKDGSLRDRACNAPGSAVSSEDGGKWCAQILKQRLTPSSPAEPKDFRLVNVGNTGRSGSAKTYFVNVMSAGPDGEFDTYDDIWSFPDDFE